MSGNALFELTAEVEAAVRAGPPARRARMLEQASAFFLANSNRLGPTQLGVFDEVLARLTEHAEPAALSALSTALAALKPGPQQTIRRLALHEDPAVAVPVLEKSDVICDEDLIEIANHRGQSHLLAISSRQRLNEALTDAVLRHSGKEATRRLAGNPGAWLSRQSYKVLLVIAAGDDTLAETLALRPDIPAETLQKLLSAASDAVCATILKASAAAAAAAGDDR